MTCACKNPCMISIEICCAFVWGGGTLKSTINKNVDANWKKNTFWLNIAIESAFEQVKDKFKGETKGQTNGHLNYNYEGC